MQFVIVTSSLGRIHGYVRHGEGVKLELLASGSSLVNELWFFTEPRRKDKGIQGYWTLVWYRDRSGTIRRDSVRVEPLQYF